MRSLRALAAVLILASFATAKDKPAGPYWPDVTERGKRLAAYHQAMSEAALLLAAGKAPSPEEVQTCLAQQRGQGWGVYCGRLDDKQESFLVAYELPPQGALLHHSPATSATGFLPAAAKAIAIVSASLRKVQANSAYAVILASDGTLFVYWYPAELGSRDFPTMQDVRAHVSADGSHVIELHKMHDSVMRLPSTIFPPGEDMAGRTHGHLGDKAQVEDTDVAHVLIAEPGKSGFVSAKGGMYEIQPDGTIINIGENLKDAVERRSKERKLKAH